MTLRCIDCNSIDLHTLAWVDNNNQYVSESAYSQNGEYWCTNCQENKEGYKEETNDTQG